jgi:hypothetical protein
MWGAGGGEGKSVQITGAWPSGRRPRTDYVAHSSAIICRLYKVNLSYQAQVTLQHALRVFDLVSRFLAGPPFLGAKKSHGGPNPLSAALKMLYFSLLCQHSSSNT